MITHHAQHRLTVLPITAIWTNLRSHLSRCGICLTGQERSYCSAHCQRAWRIVRDSCNHEQCAKVSITQTKFSIVVRISRDLFTREMCHENCDLEDDRP